MVMPSFSTLLPASTFNVISYRAPFFSTWFYRNRNKEMSISCKNTKILTIAENNVIGRASIPMCIHVPCCATRASICLSSSRVYGTGPFPPWDCRKNVYLSLHFAPSLSILEPIPCQLISSSAEVADLPCFLFRKAFFLADTTDFNFLSW